MALDCAVCPTPTALTDIPYNPCTNIFGKDKRWAIQRYAEANKFDGTISPPEGIEEAASWSALPDASDVSKVVITPILEDVDFPEPEKLEDGQNPEGAPIFVAYGPAMVSAVIRNPTRLQWLALQELACDPNPLVFYRFDSNGNIGCRVVETDIHNGIYISEGTFAVSPVFRGGTDRTNVPYKVRVSFYLAANWYANFVVVAPETGFNPNTDIYPS